MKIRLYALALPALLFIAACRSSPTGPNAGVIMPLAVGNTWIAEHNQPDPDLHTGIITSTLDTLRIESIVRLGDETWYRANTGESYANRPDGLYYRMSDAAAPSLIVKYPASIGDTLNMETVVVTNEQGQTAVANVAITVDATDSTLKVHAGTYHCYVYRSHVVTPDSLRQLQLDVRCFVPGVGPVLLKGTPRNLGRWALRSFVLK